MTYWRMQLHPGEPGKAMWHAATSLSSGFVGLDFEQDLGDLSLSEAAELPSGQKDCIAFANEMQIGDTVLVIVHHFPLALATIDGPYNYIRDPVSEIGVWFRHFRRVRDISYYSDWITNANSWERLTMTDTLSPLRDPESRSHTLISRWKAHLTGTATND